MPRFYIISGEASGDLHASNLICALRTLDPSTEVRGYGGDRSESAGMTLVRHYRDTAVMGFLNVLLKARTLRRNLRLCAEDLIAYHPDAAIFVDYGGFNLRIARKAKAAGISTVFYISPKVWAWNTSRVKTIKKVIDNMLVIFPFEVDFYQRYHYPVFYGGNPLVDALSSVDLSNAPDEKLIALLPGSRTQEILSNLPLMLQMVERFPSYRFEVAGAPGIEASLYERVMKRSGVTIPVIVDATYTLLSKAHAAVVTSGTATLEAALLRVPEVVCYKGEGGVLSYLGFKCFVKVKFFSLVNLVLGRKCVEELLMQRANPRRLEAALSALLQGEGRTRMLRDYDELAERIGPAGASSRFAEQILTLYGKK